MCYWCRFPIFPNEEAVVIEGQRFHSERVEGYISCSEAYTKHTQEITWEVREKIKQDLIRADESERKAKGLA